MDWYLDCTEASQVTLVRREIIEYLGRHCVEGSDLQGAGIVVSELLSNVVRHSPGPAWVHIAWHDSEPVLDVHDLGPGFELNPALPSDPYALAGRGLAISAALTLRLERAAKRAGGSKVTAVLPVRRLVEANVDPPVRTGGGLPAPEEAEDDGLFRKEPFLRALVVELARGVDHRDGPDATAQLVADVGMNVGASMEAEYRRARTLVGQLDHEQLADLFVRLKAAIDGDFYVVDADERRIILGNRVCPFGDAVKRAPGLCRMTSSVFGGIAARNTGGASVLLEERIAVGDPECRVVVWLTDKKAGKISAAHDYAGESDG